MPSVSGQQRTFYLLLLAMFMLHGSFLAVKFRDEFTKVSFTPRTEAIKVKLVQEAIREMVQTENKKQIVQSEDSASNEKPKDPAFLSDKDRSFDRQTIASRIDTFKKAAQGNAAVTQTATQPQKAQKKAPSLKDLKLSDFGIASGAMAPEPTRAPASASQSGLKNGDPTELTLSATNDYVQEMALGDFTHLNTVEFKFYGFYHRIRSKLEQFWGRSIQEKSMALFRSGRRMPAGEDLITSLRITLDAQGEIIAVKILGTSGVKELDDAAIESFNQAGPFPNPPKELLVNGAATIEWGFVVKS